jgi:hypothetical protein
MRRGSGEGLWVGPRGLGGVWRAWPNKEKPRLPVWRAGLWMVGCRLGGWAFEDLGKSAEAPGVGWVFGGGGVGFERGGHPVELDDFLLAEVGLLGFGNGFIEVR